MDVRVPGDAQARVTRAEAIASGRAPRRDTTLRVGLDLAFLVDSAGGAGTYARHLIPHMLEVEPTLELTAWIGATASASLRDEPWADQVRWIRLPVPGVGSVWHLWHDLVGIGLDARRRGIDVVHGLANIGSAVHPGVASVTTMLDVIWSRYPETTARRFLIVNHLVTRLAGRSADRIIAISNAARDDVARTLGLDVRKFDVTPLGVSVPPRRPPPADENALRIALGLGPEPVVLCVAGKRPHKNLHGLIRAWALLADPRPQLVLPGAPNDYELELRALGRELGVQDSVRFLGWVSDEALEDLYTLAQCVVLASFEEGFGLPVLEAMAREVPVACSDIAALSEVVADAALLFDPGAPASIAGAVTRVLGDPELAAELAARGRERCRLFTWRRTAEATLASYRRALGDRAVG